ncbi:MAG: YfiR family protein [Bacteroidetes bacterium]|jgi:hypothetical protein|nr:YfiR family protein [Bacteroidota bacterium]
MKQLFYFCLLVICPGFLFSPLHLKSQVKATPENIMASFIYNFTNYLSWSSDDLGEDFEIVVLGESTLLEPLKYIGNTKKVTEKTINVVHVQGVSELKPCHILVVGEDFTKTLSELYANTLLKNAIIITYCNGCLQKGASINFVTESERLRFEINKTTLDSKSIKASSQLLKLAIKVI